MPIVMLKRINPGFLIENLIQTQENMFATRKHPSLQWHRHCSIHCGVLCPFVVKHCSSVSRTSAQVEQHLGERVSNI